MAAQLRVTKGWVRRTLRWWSARQQFFAGAGLALEDHGGIGRRHDLELREHRRERRTAPDDPVDVVLGLQALAAVWSCPTTVCSSVAALLPVELLYPRSHNVPSWRSSRG
jgi:hypothetical protein